MNSINKELLVLMKIINKLTTPFIPLNAMEFAVEHGWEPYEKLEMLEAEYLITNKIMLMIFYEIFGRYEKEFRELCDIVLRQDDIDDELRENIKKIFSDMDKDTYNTYAFESLAKYVTDKFYKSPFK